MFRASSHLLYHLFIIQLTKTANKFAVKFITLQVTSVVENLYAVLLRESSYSTRSIDNVIVVIARKCTRRNGDSPMYRISISEPVWSVEEACLKKQIYYGSDRAVNHLSVAGATLKDDAF